MGRAALRNERAKSDYKVVKKCPECDKEIPVACKTCPMCKLSVSGGKPSKSEKDESEKDKKEGTPTKIRRTERVRRERPDFFNPIDLDSQVKRKRRRKESTETKTSVDAASPTSEGSNGRKGRRGRPKSVSTQESIEKESITPPEDDFSILLPPEKTLQYKVILAELNRKFYSQNFSPL